MHDIADLESRGVRGVFVASTAFIDAARTQAVAIGVESAAVFVPHPIQDRDDAEMRALAEDAVEQILTALTGG